MVQWVTRDAGAAPTVRWGTSPDVLAAAASGDSLTYSRADMCGAPANASGWMEPGMLHGAVMGGLQPLTAYYYQYGDEVRLAARLCRGGGAPALCGGAGPWEGGRALQWYMGQ